MSLLLAMALDVVDLNMENHFCTEAVSPCSVLHSRAGSAGPRGAKRQ